jgi:hypothetical protein
MDAIQYQDAYANLLEEIQSLIARNALAEEETAKLSAFNAEILGSQNPSKRIAYLERVRSELAEAKQRILMLSREHEILNATVKDLHHELEMYRSVPTDAKPRTGFTRVQRVPLGTSQSVNARSLPVRSVREDPGRVEEVEYREGDMTIDELT